MVQVLAMLNYQTTWLCLSIDQFKVASIDCHNILRQRHFGWRSKELWLSSEAKRNKCAHLNPDSLHYTENAQSCRTHRRAGLSSYCVDIRDFDLKKLETGLHRWSLMRTKSRVVWARV